MLAFRTLHLHSSRPSDRLPQLWKPITVWFVLSTESFHLFRNLLSGRSPPILHLSRCLKTLWSSLGYIWPVHRSSSCNKYWFHCCMSSIIRDRPSLVLKFFRGLDVRKLWFLPLRPGLLFTSRCRDTVKAKSKFYILWTLFFSARIYFWVAGKHDTSVYFVYSRHFSSIFWIENIKSIIDFRLLNSPWHSPIVIQSISLYSSHSKICQPNSFSKAMKFGRHPHTSSPNSHNVLYSPRAFCSFSAF